MYTGGILESGAERGAWVERCARGSPRQSERAGVAAADLWTEAVALQRQGRLEEAAALFARMLELQPRSAEVLHQLGAIAGQSRRYEQALAYFDRAIALTPRLPALHLDRALALRALQRFAEALAAYQRALELDSRFARAHAGRGNVYMDLSC